MKQLSIFVVVLLFVCKGVSQESDDEYEDDDEYQDEEVQSEEDEDEDEEDEGSYFDFYQYFDFTNDEYSNVRDKVDELTSEEEEELYKFVVEVQQDRVLKDRLFGELVAKIKKKKPYKGKDSPGFSCVIRGLVENKTVYDAIIKDGRSEYQARNAAALSERIIRRKCGVTKKKLNKEE